MGYVIIAHPLIIRTYMIAIRNNDGIFRFVVSNLLFHALHRLYLEFFLLSLFVDVTIFNRELFSL